MTLAIDCIMHVLTFPWNRRGTYREGLYLRNEQSRNEEIEMFRNEYHGHISGAKPSIRAQQSTCL